MIKVFVVDDEKLVRRGIIGLIDWERFGMEIVGDSGSGEGWIFFFRIWKCRGFPGFLFFRR